MKRLVVVALAVVLGLTACSDETTTPSGDSSPQLSQGSSRSISGWLHTQWGDPRGGRGSAQVRHELIDDLGRATELLLDEGLVARLGGSLALSRKRVRIDGQETAPGWIQVRSLELERAAGPAGAASAEPAAAPRIGSYPYVTIGCKFSDIAAEPHTIATYATWTTGTSYPGLNHYWPELSFNQMNVTGSTMVGWYTLPQPRSHYVTASGLDLAGLVADCTGAADPDVNLPQFYGINMQFNAVLDCCSWGGSWTVTADGQTKTYGMTWMADWADVAVYAHEEGHSLGLPHSSGPYGQVYDSQWDIMSNPYIFFDFNLDTYIPQHTISYHKDLLGWIAPSRKTTVALNTSQTITLERLAQPGTGNYLMAQIPIDNAPGVFYTVEARRLVGSYDSHIPGDAVVLHRVNGQAQVVDVDNNGDPNDAGAMWTPGETFTDAANKISVQVTAMTATGFQVTITHGTVTTSKWAGKASMPTARKQLAAAVVSGVLYAIGGVNAAGSVLNRVEAYNPSTSAWTTKASLPSPRWRTSGAATINNVLYVAGGLGAGTAGYTRTLYAFNAASNTWSTKAPMPVPGGCGASWPISGILYVMIGCDGTTTPTSGAKGILLRYDPGTNTWSTKSPAPGAHQYPGLAGVGGKLYVVGGKNSSGVASTVVHAYDPATNTWSTKAPLPSARYSLITYAISGKLYAVGGNDAGGSFTNTVYIYDPAVNTWTTGSSAMPTARASLTGGMITGVLYAVGGYNSGAAVLGTNEAFTP